MKRYSLKTLITLCILCFLGTVSESSAQTFDFLGFNTLTDTEYQCVRFASKKNNTILTINSKSGAQRNFSIKQAKRKLKGDFKKVSRQIKNIKKLKRRAEKRLKKLIRKVAANPKHQLAIEKAKEQVAKLDVRLATASGDRNNIGELRKSLKVCARDLPVNGNVEVISGTYELAGSTRFYTRLIYRVLGNPSKSRICARVDGHSTPIEGASGTYYSPPPAVSNLFIRFGDVCVASNFDDCLASEPGPFVVLAGINGVLAPGNCSRASDCSITEARSVLSERAAQIRIVATKLTNESTCQ